MSLAVARVTVCSRKVWRKGSAFPKPRTREVKSTQVLNAVFICCNGNSSVAEYTAKDRHVSIYSLAHIRDA